MAFPNLKYTIGFLFACSSSQSDLEKDKQNHKVSEPTEEIVIDAGVSDACHPDRFIGYLPSGYIFDFNCPPIIYDPPKYPLIPIPGER